MKAWRYLEPRYAAAALTMGSLRVGTASSFAQLEGTLADPLDSALLRTLDHLHIGNSDDEPSATALAASMGIFLKHCTNGTITNARMVHSSPPRYCLCLSDRPDNKHLLTEGRTAVVEIKDVAEFAAGLAAASARLGAFAYGRVRYLPRDVPARSLALGPDPFLKGEAFAAEREVRIVWLSVGGEPSAFNVLAPELIPLMALRT